MNFLDDLALGLLDDLKLAAPIDAFELAQRAGLQVRPLAEGDGCIMGRTIFFPEDAPNARQHGVICHELAHYHLDVWKLANTERNADYLGAALLVPVVPFTEDLDEVGFDLVRLRARHPNASWSLLGRRVVEMMGGGVSMWRGQSLVWARGDAPLEQVRHFARRKLFVANDDFFVMPLERGFTIAIQAA